MKVGRYVILAALVTGGAIWGWREWRNKRESVSPANTTTLPTYDDSAYNTRAPAGVRIKVEVLNATKRTGLARRATEYLRDRGFDVVAIGNNPDPFEQTLVLDRSNHPDWAKLVGRAMNARVATRPDTSRYLDVTVLVGSDWNPPALPFYP